MALLALVFAISPPRLDADIILNERETEAIARAVVVGGGADIPPKVTQVGFSAANLGNSAGASGFGISADASVTSNSDIILDAAAGTLRVTGFKSASGSVTGGGADSSGAGFTALTFTLTDMSYTYTLTGQVSGTASLITNGDARVRLSDKFDIFVSVNRSSDSKTLSESGTLDPGTYTFFGFASFSAANGNASGRANFDFRVNRVGTPTPPIRWNNPVGGSFQTDTNWDPETVPGPNNTAIFGLATPYTVNVGTAASSRLEVRNGALIFTNLNYTVGATLFDPASVVIDNAELTLGNGALRSVHALIGESAASRVEVNAGAAWTNTGSLRVGGPGEGILAIADGGTVTSGEGRIATGIGGGDVILAGVNARWASGNLAVGFSGDGSLTIDDGAMVKSGIATVGFQTGASGVVTIQGVADDADGTRSRWDCDELIVGEGGAGTVKLNQGGLFVSGKTTVNDTLSIENGSISGLQSSLSIGKLGPGEVTVSGFDAAIPFNSLLGVKSETTIGETNSGFLTIVDGGSVSSDSSARIGVGGAGEVFVKGTGNGFASTWTMNGDLAVGDSQAGTLEIADGAEVSATDVVVGTSPGSVGRITVDGKSTIGPSKLSASGKLVLGLEGNGTLIITEDAMVTCAEGTLPVFSGSEGLVELGVAGAAGAPAQWTVNGNLTVGGVGRGRVLLDNGAIVTVGGQLTVLTNGTIAGTGTLDAPLRLVQNGGTIAPGLSPGLLTINANFEQTSTGVLKMEIAGTAPGQFDVLRVTGVATLGGTLEVTFLDGYLPRTGDTFEFLQIDGSVTGDFAEVVFPQLAPGFQFETGMVNGKHQLTALNDGVRLFAKGMSGGLLNGDPASHEAAGFFTIRTTARRGFSARFVLGGRSFPLRGKFNAGGTFSKTIPRPGASPLMVTLELSATDARLVTGTISDGEHTIPISTDRTNAFNAKTNPAPQAGKYTAVLKFDPAASGSPRANGIGTVVISKSGGVRFAGALPDGTRLSQGTVLSQSGEWPLYVLLYKKQGSLFGELQFRETAGSDFDGTLRWSRPPTPAHKIQTAGFLATLPAIGSRYVAPPARPAVLDLPNGATASLSDADLTPALTKSLTLTPPNKFVVTDPGADKFSLSANTSNGQLSGRFIHPNTGLSTTVQGVVFQKQNSGFGFFLRSGVIGSFELQARP